MQKIHLKNIDEKQFNIKNIYLDGAHNEGGIEAMCNFVNQLKQDNVSQNIIGVFACLKRKDYMSFVPILSKANFDKLFFYNVPKDVNDFVPPQELHTIATNNAIKSEVVEDINDLKLQLSKTPLTKPTTIIFFGSLYFIGYIMENDFKNSD